MSYPTSSYTRWAKMSIDFSANFAPQSKFVQNQRKLVENSLFCVRFIPMQMQYIVVQFYYLKRKPPTNRPGP